MFPRLAAQEGATDTRRPACSRPHPWFSWQAGEVKLDASLLGYRLTVRYRLPGAREGEPSMSDVVGILRRIEADTAVMERRDGSIAHVHVPDVLIVKVVPQRPLRRRRARHVAAEGLQAIASRGWPAIESVPLGQWELRASHGFSKRANSAAASGDPQCSLGDALTSVREFYHTRSLPARVQVVADSPLEAHLRDAGWSQQHADVVVRVLDLGHHRSDDDVRTTDNPDDDWLAFLQPETTSETARAVLSSPDRTAFLSLGDPIQAITRVSVTGEWAGVFCVHVAPSSRRQGHATSLIETALAAAAQAGADKAYAQVEETNDAAMELFDRLGFLDHHKYRYLEPA